MIFCAVEPIDYADFSEKADWQLLGVAEDGPNGDNGRVPARREWAGRDHFSVADTPLSYVER